MIRGREGKGEGQAVGLPKCVGLKLCGWTKSSHRYTAPALPFIRFETMKEKENEIIEMMIINCC